MLEELVLPFFFRDRADLDALFRSAARKAREEARKKRGRAVKDATLSSPFFFAIVTTLRLPEVEVAAGEREGAAMVMRVPQTEDLRRALMVAWSARGKKRRRREEKKRSEKEPSEVFFHFFLESRTFRRTWTNVR